MADPNIPVPADDFDEVVLSFCKAKSGLQSGVRAATTAVLALDDGEVANRIAVWGKTYATKKINWPQMLLAHQEARASWKRKQLEMARKATKPAGEPTDVPGKEHGK